MPSYETLDAIADAHDPMLGALWIGLSLFPLLALRWRTAAARALLGLACLLPAYALMWLENATGAWAAVGLDYSTHTGVALAMVVTLAVIHRRAGRLALSTFAAYVPLMVIQGYHTIVDIGATALAVAALSVAPAMLLCKSVRARRGPDPSPVSAAAGGAG